MSQPQKIGVVSGDGWYYILDSITVIDRTYENLFGPVAALVIGVGMLALVVVRALWERKRDL